MANIIKFTNYNFLDKKTEKRNINIEHIVEVIELYSYDGKPLTRLKLLNGDFIDVQESLNNIVKLINNK